MTLTGTVQLDTFFMPLFGVPQVQVGAASEIKRASNGLMVALVLDNTGSMWSSGNIASLRTASANLVEGLFDGEDTHDDLRVAVVPYSAAVNPGEAAESIVAAHSFGDRDPADKTKWKGCVVERTGDDTLGDTPASTAEWSVFWYPSASDNNYNINTPSTIIPGGASDSNGITGPNIGCPTEIQPLTDTKATALAAVNAMTAWNRGGTLTDIGVAWGRRVLSPGEPFTESTEVDPQSGQSLWESQRWRKAMVIMTDGESQFFNFSGTAGPNTSHPSASDYGGYGRLGETLANAIFGSSNQTTVKSMINDRIEAMCTELKEDGVILYTVVFTSSVGQTVKDMYQRCASDPGKYWYAPNGAALHESFDQIGDDLSSLRLSR